MTRIPALGPRGEGWVALQLVLFAMIAVAGVFLPGELSGTSATFTSAVGISLIVAGGLLGLAGLAGLQRASALTAVPRPRDDSRLTDTGAYALVLGAIGWALLRGSPAALLAAVALFVVLDLKRRREEFWLMERYPDYAAYRTRTRRLIPWIW